MYFRSKIGAAGLYTLGGLFPVQMLAIDQDIEPVRLHKALLAAGIRTVLLRARTRFGLRMALILNASHSIDDVDRAVTALLAALGRTGLKPSRATDSPAAARGVVMACGDATKESAERTRSNQASPPWLIERRNETVMRLR